MGLLTSLAGHLLYSLGLPLFDEAEGKLNDINTTDAQHGVYPNHTHCRPNSTTRDTNHLTYPLKPHDSSAMDCGPANAENEIPPRLQFVFTGAVEAVAYTEHQYTLRQLCMTHR